MIHQAKSNPQLLDEQIFSERLASAISAIGTFETCPSVLRMSVHRGRPEVAVVEAHSEVDVGSRAAQTNTDIILPL